MDATTLPGLHPWPGYYLPRALCICRSDSLGLRPRSHSGDGLCADRAGTARPGDSGQARFGDRIDGVACFLAADTLFLRSILSPTSTLPYIVDLQVYSWNPLNALRREFVTSDGLLSYPWPNGLWYALAPHRFYFTALLAPLLLPGLWAVARRRAQRRSCSCRMGSSYFCLSRRRTLQNFRFNLAHLPPLAILVAIGVETIALWLVRRLNNGVVRRLALLVLAGYVVAGMLYGARRVEAHPKLRNRKNTELALVRKSRPRCSPLLSW